jgi:hypothetical protein
MHGTLQQRLLPELRLWQLLRTGLWLRLRKLLRTVLRHRLWLML